MWGNQRGKKGKRGEKQAGVQTEAGEQASEGGNAPANGLGNLTRLVPEAVAVGIDEAIRVLEKVGFIQHHYKRNHSLLIRDNPFAMPVVSMGKKKLRGGTLRGIIYQAGMKVEASVALL